MNIEYFIKKQNRILNKTPIFYLLIVLVTKTTIFVTNRVFSVSFVTNR